MTETELIGWVKPRHRLATQAFSPTLRFQRSFYRGLKLADALPTAGELSNQPSKTSRGLTL